MFFTLVESIKGPVNCTDGNIRLFNNKSDGEGILHVCANNAWGTVCYNYFDTRDANVVCHQLGYSAYSKYTVYNVLY